MLKNKSDDAVIDDLVYKWVNNEFDQDEARAWFDKVTASYDRFDSSEDEKAALRQAVDICLSKLQ